MKSSFLSTFLLVLALPVITHAAIYNTGGIGVKDNAANNKIYSSEFNIITKALENIYYNSSSQKVGIGISSPQALLHVSGVQSEKLRLEDTVGGYYGFEVNNSGQFKIHKDGVGNRFVINGDGRIGIGTGSPAAGIALVSSRPIISLGSDDGDNKGIRLEYNEDAEELRIQSSNARGGFGGDTIMVVQRDSQKVGIGDMTPDGALKLDVEGKIGATEYCDENGNNCTAAADLGGSGADGAGGIIVKDLITPNYTSGYTSYTGPKDLSTYHILEFGGFDANTRPESWDGSGSGTASTMMLILPYGRGAVNFGSNGQDAKILAELDANKRITFRFKQELSGRPRLAFARAITFKGGMEAGPTSAPNVVESFISQYVALMNDPTFRDFVGSDRDLPVHKYRDDHGWYKRDTNSNKFKFTADQLCAFFMENGKYANKFWSADYGSNNNNHAKWFDRATNDWKSEPHGDNGGIDITRLNCEGKRVLPRGQFWLEKNRKEKCGGAYAPWQGGRCNPYPVPPRR